MGKEAATQKPKPERSEQIQQIQAQPKPPQKIAGKRFEDYLKDLHSGDPKVRIKGIVSIQRSGDPRAAAELTAMLTDSDTGVKVAAITALGWIRDRSVVPALITTLDTDKEKMVKSEAARVLGELGDRRAVPILTTALSDAAWEVRRSAVLALGRIGDPSTKWAVRKKLEDRDARVRMAAAYALGDVGGKIDLPDLIYRRFFDPNPDVKSEAAKAIEKILKK